MHTTPKLNVALFFMLPLTMLLFLVACGPSQGELDAAATQSAADAFAAQTAEAPTTTPKPTDAPIPTSTPTPEPPTVTPTPVPPTLIPKSPPEKILFVGSSITGIWHEQHIENIAASLDPSLAIEADSLLVMGGWLEDAWKDSEAREWIDEGGYDVVVLQEGPEANVDTFHEHARKYDAEIKDAGAETVLFMAWPFEDPEMSAMDEIAQSHYDIATELGLEIAPVGLAFQRVMEERPDLEMTSDGVHAGIYGKYLSINVVYATLFGGNPIDLAYLPPEFDELTEEEAAFLQRIALETVLEYQAK
jgi:hypothetical protein